MSGLGAAEQVAKKMQQTEEGRKQLDWARDLRQDQQRKWMTDAFGQPFGGWKAAHDAYLWRLYEFWFMGELAVTRLPMGCTPYADKQREANHAALQALKLIDGPQVSAKVDMDQCLSPDGDGSLTWENEITLGIIVPGDPILDAWAHVNPIGPRSAVPLEIGYTDPVTTYMHLLDGQGVARWAYGSNEVVLMVGSTWVREVETLENPPRRWKPKDMWRPFQDLESIEVA